MKNITEARAIKAFSAKYGDDFYTRFDKLKEEFAELEQAIELCFTKEKPTAKMWAAVDDELSDVQCVLTHLSSIRNLGQRQLIDMGLEKQRIRETNPGYKKSK